MWIYSQYAILEIASVKPCGTWIGTGGYKMKKKSRIWMAGVLLLCMVMALLPGAVIDAAGTSATITPWVKVVCLGENPHLYEPDTVGYVAGDYDMRWDTLLEDQAVEIGTRLADIVNLEELAEPLLPAEGVTYEWHVFAGEKITGTVEDKGLAKDYCFANGETYVSVSPVFSDDYLMVTIDDILGDGGSGYDFIQAKSDAELADKLNKKYGTVRGAEFSRTFEVRDEWYYPPIRSASVTYSQARFHLSADYIVEKDGKYTVERKALLNQVYDKDKLPTVDDCVTVIRSSKVPEISGATFLGWEITDEEKQSLEEDLKTLRETTDSHEGFFGVRASYDKRICVGAYYAGIYREYYMEHPFEYPSGEIGDHVEIFDLSLSKAQVLDFMTKVSLEGYHSWKKFVPVQAGGDHEASDWNPNTCWYSRTFIATGEQSETPTGGEGTTAGNGGTSTGNEGTSAGGGHVILVSVGNEAIRILGDAAVVPGDAVFTSSKLTDGSAYRAAAKLVQELVQEFQAFRVFDFSLTAADGAAIHELGSYVQVRMPVPDGMELADGMKYQVYRVEGDALLPCETSVKDGSIVFLTNHFSTYVLTVEKDAAQGLSASGGQAASPKTGGGDGFVWVCALVLACGFGVLLAVRRRQSAF